MFSAILLPILDNAVSGYSISGACLLMSVMH
jgi:hypothetical protein